MTPNRSHSDTVGRVANKVRVEGGEPLLLRSKISLFLRTSCARFLSISSPTIVPTFADVPKFMFCGNSRWVSPRHHIKLWQRSPSLNVYWTKQRRDATRIGQDPEQKETSTVTDPAGNSNHKKDSNHGSQMRIRNPRIKLRQNLNNFEWNLRKCQIFEQKF